MQPVPVRPACMLMMALLLLGLPPGATASEACVGDAGARVCVLQSREAGTWCASPAPGHTSCNAWQAEERSARIESPALQAGASASLWEGARIVDVASGPCRRGESSRSSGAALGAHAGNGSGEQVRAHQAASRWEGASSMRCEGFRSDGAHQGWALDGHAGVAGVTSVGNRADFFLAEAGSVGTHGDDHASATGLSAGARAGEQAASGGLATSLYRSSYPGGSCRWEAILGGAAPPPVGVHHLGAAHATKCVG